MICKASGFSAVLESILELCPSRSATRFAKYDVSATNNINKLVALKCVQFSPIILDSFVIEVYSDFNMSPEDYGESNEGSFKAYIDASNRT